MLKIEKDIPLKETLNELSQFPRFSLIEKIDPRFYATAAEASIEVAQQIKDAILEKNRRGKTFVLGLATGSTPLRVYKELIRMCKQGELSFKNVVTFNLDEYYPITKENLESYNHYMSYYLFNHIDIPKENINIPDGEVPREEVTKYCEDYEKKINSYGGIDLQILGIGRTGHIGFNQPPSPQKSITRLVYLHRLTRKDAANSFGGLENVPKCAITMGIETISKAKRIIIMAWSQSKSYIVKRAIEGEKSNDVPSTFLHDHPNAVFYLDKAAGQDLSRFNIPWTIKGDKEDPKVPHCLYWILKMVMWLSKKTKKPILRLVYEDYEDHGLAPLIMECADGKTEDLNLFVFKKMIAKITGWPIGNRPDFKDTEPHEIAKVSIKSERVLIFSPHPDDDVISMGGTLKRLKQQSHKVSVAYMTSGSNGVRDYDAEKYLYFMKDFLRNHFFQISKEEHKQIPLNIIEKMVNSIDSITESKQWDLDMVRQVKTLIRSSEAKIAVHGIGVAANDVYCLNLPFYSKKSERKEPSEEDYARLRDLLQVTEPTVIYAAGDLTDPHGTHRKCLNIMLHVYEEEQKKLKQDSTHVSLFPPPEKIFFYRGAWEEWELAMTRIIVPMSPTDVEQKIHAILKHQSQKDHPMFPGDDKREFWLRSKERNRETAEELKALGLPEYEACECFVDFNDLLNYDEL